MFKEKHQQKSKILRGSFTNSIIITIIIFFINGCASAPQFIKSDFAQKQISKIAIMPIVDNRNEDNKEDSKEVLEYLEKLMAENLKDRDYDVVTADKVASIVKESNITDLTPKNLCAILKTDAIILGDLNHIKDIFFINHSLNMNLELYYSDGEKLWENKAEGSYYPFAYFLGYSLGYSGGVLLNKNMSSDLKSPAILGGIAGISIAAIISDALKDDIDGYIENSFYSLPLGKGSGKIIDNFEIE